MFAQFWPTMTYSARCFRQAWYYILHRHIAKFRMRNTDDGLSCLKMRISHHLGGPVDTSRGDSVLFHAGQQIRGTQATSPVGDELVKFGLALAPRFVGRIAFILCHFGAP